MGSNNTAEVVDAALTPRKADGGVYAQFVEPGDQVSDCPVLFDDTATRVVQPRQQMSLIQTNPQHCRMPPQWWLLEVYTFSLQTTAAGVASEPIPSWGAVYGTGGRCTSAKISVSQQGDATLLDVGAGNRYSFFGDNINVKLDVPGPAQKLQSNQQAAAAGGLQGLAAGALVNTTIVLATLRANIAPVGRRTGKQTCTVAVLAGAANIGQFVPIPNRALTVRVYQDLAGGVPTPMNFTARAAITMATAVDRGQIDFTPATQATPELEIPGNACFIATGVQTRMLTFVFETEL